MIKKRDKRGNILTENIIFIILNLTFLTILILFLFLKTGDSAVLEEKYAKQIALIIDSAKPVMKIKLNMEDAIEKAKKENFDINKIININENIVTIKLREKGGYSYSFFNNVQVEKPYLSNNGKEYIIIINGYK